MSFFLVTVACFIGSFLSNIVVGLIALKSEQARKRERENEQKPG